MKIVADENIVAVNEYFADAGSLLTVPGREISPRLLRDADALLVRSVTRVDEALLEGSRVRYVGSATAGVDHIDQDYLRRSGIAFRDAAGANANSVVEYVFGALAALRRPQGRDWLDCSIGIIGAGHIGGLLARRLAALGMDVAVSDPFLSPARLAAGRLCGLEEVLRQDVISLHTPLTREGEHPTWHLFDEARIAALAPGQVLINAARGAVVDNRALLARLREAGDLQVVLDTWENEPDIDLDLLARVSLATPHIAGYSLDGKRGGTERIFDGFRGHFGLEQLVSKPAQDECFEIDLGLCPDAADSQALINHCILCAYNILADHLDMLALPGNLHPGRQFDRLRKQYGPRHEFGHYRVQGVPDQRTAQMLSALGFETA